MYAFPVRNYDPRTSRWLSADPALEEYLPIAPTSDEAREHNQNLPGMGGVFNIQNLVVYHYTNNNPLRYTDPDGREVSDEDIRSAFIDWIRTRDKRLGSTDGDILRYIEDTVVRDGSIPTTEEIAEQAESALPGC